MPQAKKLGLHRKAWNLLRLAVIWPTKSGPFRLPRGGCKQAPHFEKMPVVHMKMRLPRSMQLHMARMFPCIDSKVDFHAEFDSDVENRVCDKCDSSRKTCTPRIFSCIDPKVNFHMEFDDDRDRVRDGCDTRKKTCEPRIFPCIDPKVDFHMEFNDQDGNRVCDGCDSSKKTTFVEDRDEEERFYDADDRGIGHEEEERGIDLKSEEFIVKFRKHLLLERQNSCPEDNELPNLSLS